jgi:hypothetical protein
MNVVCIWFDHRFGMWEMLCRQVANDEYSRVLRFGGIPTCHVTAIALDRKRFNKILNTAFCLQLGVRNSSCP